MLSELKDSEQRKVIQELESLNQRWATVTSSVGERMKLLEKLSDVAKQFQDAHEPVLAWLEQTDKKFASLEPKSPAPEAIEKIIVELKVRVTVMPTSFCNCGISSSFFVAVFHPAFCSFGISSSLAHALYYSLL